MRRSTLIARSLRFHARTHLGVVAGCAISAAVLTGALFIGDSVRGSLAEAALVRVGGIHHALEARSRWFADDLAGRVGGGAAAVLRVDAMAIRRAVAGSETPSRQVNRVELLGVDAAFFALAPDASTVALGDGEVALGETLAADLGVAVGEEVSLRMAQPSVVSRDAPLVSASDDDTQRRTAKVVAILGADRLGRFSLRTDQASPRNAFVDRAWLAKTLELDGRANLLVTGPGARPFREVWTLDDAGLAIRATADTLVLETPRIYLDPPVADAALALAPDATGATTYLVEGIAVADGASTPYSFMTALTPRDGGVVPAGMADDRIVVNRWLATHLGVGPNDEVVVSYSELAAGDDFVKRDRVFTVHSVVEMEALAAERALVPEFPGLTDVDTCAAWDIGLTTDPTKLADPSNEAYWKEHRATPKAFVTLAAGRSMWSNRYGELMSVRFPATGRTPERLHADLRGAIDPATLGLVLRPVREEALAAANRSMDLGQLFLGMSFFLIIASLLLTGLLFVFTIEQRAAEMGVLRAVGWPPGQVTRLLLGEGIALATLGSVAGVPLGWLFARALLGGLASAWSGAIAGAPVSFHATPTSAAIGVVAATIVSAIAMALAIRRAARRPARALIAGARDEAVGAAPAGGALRLATLALGAVGAIGLSVAAVLASPAQTAPLFFGAGAATLIAGIAAIRIALLRDGGGPLGIGALGRRNAARRPGRATAAATMLAVGCFMVISVGAMKEDFALVAGERASPTGGFELYAESSIPVHEDLATDAGRKAYRLSGEALDDVSLLPIRVHGGDDASCLNLNDAPAPTLLGVDPARLGELGAFADASVWESLEGDPGDGIVPAIVGDAATAMWKLKMSVHPERGSLIDYEDERGRPFQVRLVAALPTRLTVLQGRLLIAERDFERLFPSESGDRLFLIDAPAGGEDVAIQALTKKLERVGLEVVPAVERVQRFYEVESTYLLMFLVLGGLGVLLGTAGMGVLVLRNVFERRSELALLRAVGYTRGQAARVVLAEHLRLVGLGLLAGVVASAVAVGPSLARPGAQVPIDVIGGFLLGTAALSVGWVWLATRAALRSPLIPALRNE